ncbi:ABC transporter permease subunit [Longilinea arvoryzae]|nr:ABC transporter permease subunit [Longilinea arvoryzae]
MLAANPLVRTLRYVLRRLIAILLTILVGVFITVVVANGGGMLDRIAKDQVETQVRQLMWDGIPANEIEARRVQLETAAGVSLPFWPKHMLYTYRALTIDWGNVADQKNFGMFIQASGNQVIKTYDVRTIILSHLNNTLLLSGTAYLVLFLIGIPLALYLSQHEGHWLDRLVAILTPISSVPSWVIGILLVMLFAVQFRIFPVAKMINFPPPSTTWGVILQTAYHMVLPVASIVLSLIFQLVNNWRTFLLIYSEEDYVDLARAKGLTDQAVQTRYVLRPVLPYLLTGLALSLAGFWQFITALEFFFDWPGIGKLYVNALPHFLGESMFQGEISVMISIVVLFAYLLGITVFILDFMYVIVDPRLRLGEEEHHLIPAHMGERGRFQAWFRERLQGFRTLQRTPRPARKEAEPVKIRIDLRVWGENLSQLRDTLSNILHEILRSPGAVVGLSIITLLVLVSIAVTVFLPYKTIGRQWEATAITSKPIRARLALPKWVNWFRRNDLPATLVLDNRQGAGVKTSSQLTAEMTQTQIEFAFDYPYQDFPSDIVVYLTTTYAEKAPFISMTWITPDGREIGLKNVSATRDMIYKFDENVPYQPQLQKYPNWKKWFVTSGNYPTPAYDLLLADPNADQARALPGRYRLRITGTFFEPNGDLDAQLVVFGKVEGWAGTDILRRDLLVPLLWGLPIALVVGGLGAIATTLLSILIAATGAWFGGWVDAFIQHAIEANLILPVLAIGVLFNAYYGFNLWLILGLMVLLNVLGSPTKAFRAAFMQVKNADYIEAARVYGASNARIIRSYLIPRILPVLIPQIVILIPNFFFLEATLAIFNISDPRYPTWGRVIYSALRFGAAYGSEFWVLEPICLMLLTGLSFVLLGFALNRILNPHLKNV